MSTKGFSRLTARIKVNFLKKILKLIISSHHNCVGEDSVEDALRTEESVPKSQRLVFWNILQNGEVTSDGGQVHCPEKCGKNGHNV